MKIIRRDENGKPIVWCDPCIAPIVEMLNNNDLPTRASCCGHGRRPGSIVLRDGRYIIIATKEQNEKIEPLFPDINWKEDLYS